MTDAHGRRSLRGLFALYAAISLVPVLVLGVILAATFRSAANDRGLAEGRSRAQLVAQTAIDPLLAPRMVTPHLSPTALAGLRRLSAKVIARGGILRLRIRDLSGRVIYSDDGSGFRDKPDDEALDAARGHVIALRTRLNADSNDSGSSGTQAVEVYLPLTAGTPRHQVGVLELYLPYAPIQHDVTAGLHRLYLELAIGLVVLYLALFAIAVSVSRGLRREAALNAFLAEHDVLTGLPNRTHFHRRAKAAIAAARKHGTVAVGIIDLDRFKEINDTLGHQNGDCLLKELAARLSERMRPSDLVARLGGDEFGLIICGAKDPEAVLEPLREAIGREVEISGLPLSVQASVGYALAPEDGLGVDELVQRADVAMYVAKAQHTGVARYDPSLDHYDAATLSLVGELRRAIDEGQLVVHYQPQPTVADTRARAVEALVRWEHPTHGLLYPGSFLPLAEQTDVIDKLTPWVLRTALTDVRALEPVLGELTVSVNASARNVCRLGFATEVIEILAALEMPPSRLIVEVTETALLCDPQRAAVVLQQLSEAGVRISLDDFGQGQTSLGYLSALPIEELKIDRGFVLDMLDNDAHAAIVRSIIELGHNLGLQVVGEGVESDEILDRLREFGCDVVQGYLFAEAMPLEQLEEWLKTTVAAAA
jgi:diguanylate cyclase (GGDEF)-like protein